MNAPPPKLVLLIRDLGFGGAQRQLVTLARGLHGSQFDVTVVTFYGGPLAADLEAAGVPHHSVGKRQRWDLFGFFWRLARLLRRLRPGFVHGYLAESNLMALLLKPFCGWPRVIWGVRDSESDAHQWGVLGKASFKLNCLLSRFADRIIANSAAGRRWYRERGFPLEDDRFVVVPNGIDIGRFQPRPELAPSDPVLGIIGRLNPMKDHPTFLRAVALVTQEHPEARFEIIGDGPPSYLADLQIRAHNLPVTFHSAQSDLENVYPRLSALVSSSAYGEGFSNVLGEAMACGVPCIATDVGDANVVLGDTGFLCPPRDAAALASAMKRFLALSAGERAALSRKARQRIEQNFTIPQMINRTAKVVQASCLHSPHPIPHLPSPISGAALPNPTLWITTGLGTGGAEMMLTQLIAGLPQHRHTVISLTSGGKHADTLRALGVEVHTLDMPAGKPSPRALLKLIKLAWQIRPGVIMGWMYHGCLAAALVKLFRLGQGRVIWNIRQSLYDLALEKRGSALVIKSLKWLAPLAQTLTYNSQLSARQHEAIGYPAAKTRLIPNGFDTAHWQPAPLSPKEKIRIGRFGRFTAMKDYPTFLQAAALILKEQPQAEFLLAGPGVDTNNSEITRLIEQLGLQNHVQLLGERHDLPALTASLDLAVSSSAFGEGFPNVVGEAMACAVPVVATDIGDTAWVLGDTGTLVPPQDPQALATACLKILALPATERQALGTRGRNRIETHFSLQSILTHFDALLTVEQAAGSPAFPSAAEPVAPRTTPLSTPTPLRISNFDFRV